MNGNQPRKRANTAIGAVLIGLGALFLVSRVFDISLGRFIWPFFIIIPGLMFFAGMFAGGKPAAPLAVPGSIVTMTGLILLYDSLFGAWANWAYIWALIFPTSVGIGLMIHGTYSDNPAVAKTGTRWAAVGMVILLAMGMLFELVLYPLFNVERGLLNTLLWPALLIGLGLWLLRRNHHPASDALALPPVASTADQGDTPPPSRTVKANGRGNGKVSPVVGFEPIDPTKGKK